MPPKLQYAIIASAVFLPLPAVSAARDTQAVRVESFGRAQYNWIMHCQGCHGAEAQGTRGSVPRLEGTVARFLRIQAGRAYLGRIPGVALVELSDTDVAELLNWVVQYFDRKHVPKEFKPYSGEEIRILRREPLISNAYRERRKLLKSLAVGQ